MKLTNTTWMGFLLAVSAVSCSTSVNASSADLTNKSLNPVENRINRIAEVLKKKERQLQFLEESENGLMSETENSLLAGGWSNRGTRGGWIDTNRGSFINNRRGWDNWRGWDDWGRWTNYSPWRNGSGFLNRRY